MARGFLRFDNFKRVIDENIQLREIELSNFGEIFLNPHLAKIIEYAFEKNVRLSATNNSEQMQYARRMLTDAIEPRDDVPCTTCSIYKVMRKEGRTLDRSNVDGWRKGAAVPGSS